MQPLGLKVEARAWLTIFNFWLKLTFQPIGLTPLVLQDNSHLGREQNTIKSTDIAIQ